MPWACLQLKSSPCSQFFPPETRSEVSPADDGVAALMQKLVFPSSPVEPDSFLCDGRINYQTWFAGRQLDDNYDWDLWALAPKSVDVCLWW